MIIKIENFKKIKKLTAVFFASVIALCITFFAKDITGDRYFSVSLNLEGGSLLIDTGIGFFDHMLHAMLFYAGFGGEVTCKGDLLVDGHHSVEDVGIALGLALKEALGDKLGITRFASKFVPMDEALCFCALDVSGRPYLVFDASMPQPMIGDYDSCLTKDDCLGGSAESIFMNPRALLTDISNFNHVRVKTCLFGTLTEGCFMHSG